MKTCFLLLTFVPLAGGCSILPTHVPAAAPPLVDMQEDLALSAEPADEAARRALAPGSFSGLELSEARATLEEMVGAAAGIEVARVVENSPADLAGIEAGDLLVSARVQGVEHALAWPSEWRALELELAPGTEVELACDRAGSQRMAKLVLAPRVRPAAREPPARFREEARAGIVLRTPSEVEARAVGLAPGAGAVVIGLARTSPWRRAGLQFGDLIVAVDGRPLAHPQMLLDAIHAGKDALALDLARGGQRLHVQAALTRRESQLTEFSIPILYSYENDRGHSTTSALLGLYKYEKTQVAWRMRLLWFISFSGGEADRLEEVHS